MKNSLTINQRNYILYHLAFSVNISSEIASKFVFGSLGKEKICFVENKNIFDEKNITNINNIPILFPGKADEPIYTLDKGTLVFHHDLFRSAFYLLSGYQEYGSNKKDDLGRFPYEASLQSKLKVMTRPLVNEYFELIHEGISNYCNYHNIDYKKPSFFENPTLFLTHDIDRIDKYTFNMVKGKLKKKNYKDALIWFFKWVNPLYTKNPKWTYDYLMEVEKSREINSTYFFLNRGVKHIDSYYSFQDRRIKELINDLEIFGSEIGLHGSVRTGADIEIMKTDLGSLSKTAKLPIRGNRQHRLLFKLPRTMINLEKSGFIYDSSLGFAAHEGFRNSYCLPFKLFDFENDKMIDVWEIPLNVMDVTLFTYRDLDFNTAMESIAKIKEEIKRYKGIFTLLFHPDFLDEEEHPGIREFYEKVLDRFIQDDFVSFNTTSLMSL